MPAASALVKSAVATSAAVLLVAHRDQVAKRPAAGDAGCPVMRALGRVPAQATPADAFLAFPDYSV